MGARRIVVGMALVIAAFSIVWLFGSSGTEAAPNDGFWTTSFLLLTAACFCLGIMVIHSGVVATATPTRHP
jgi:hypothetical protein